MYIYIHSFIHSLIHSLVRTYKIQSMIYCLYSRSKITYELVPFTGGSDYRPFLDANIPGKHETVR